MFITAGLFVIFTQVKMAEELEFLSNSVFISQKELFKLLVNLGRMTKLTNRLGHGNENNKER